MKNKDKIGKKLGKRNNKKLVINWKRFIIFNAAMLLVIFCVTTGYFLASNVVQANRSLLSNNNIEIENKHYRYIKEIDKVLPKDFKVAYLTFDDGPTPGVTDSILNTLDLYGIKASFFMIGSNMDKYPDMVKDVVSRGHIVLNHTYTHDYKYLYENEDNFFQDVDKWDKEVKKILPEYKNRKIIRFPGGSFGHTEQKKRMDKEGYKYVDWNALTGDAEMRRASAKTNTRDYSRPKQISGIDA